MKYNTLLDDVVESCPTWMLVVLDILALLGLLYCVRAIR